MDSSLREAVRRRAGYRYEYCRLPEAVHDEQFSVDHIVARKHAGATDSENLAMCCLRCNLHKGADLSAIDPDSGAIVRVFDPRREEWGDHFSMSGATIVGMTPTGRATVRLLQMNAAERILLRRRLLEYGIRLG